MKEISYTDAVIKDDEQQKVLDQTTEKLHADLGQISKAPNSAIEADLKKTAASLNHFDLLLVDDEYKQRYGTSFGNAVSKEGNLSADGKSELQAELGRHASSNDVSTAIDEVITSKKASCVQTDFLLMFEEQLQIGAAKNKLDLAEQVHDPEAFQNSASEYGQAESALRNTVAGLSTDELSAAVLAFRLAHPGQDLLTELLKDKNTSSETKEFLKMQFTGGTVGAVRDIN